MLRGLGDGDDPVPPAPHQQCRRADASQPPAQLRVAQLRRGPAERGGPGEAAEPAQRPVVGQVVGQRLERDGSVRVGEQHAPHLAETPHAARRGGPEEQLAPRVGDVEAEGRDEDESADPGWVAQRELGGQPAAERRADDVDPVKAERAEQVGEVEGAVLDVGSGCEGVRARVAGERGGDHLGAGR